MHRTAALIAVALWGCRACPMKDDRLYDKLEEERQRLGAAGGDATKALADLTQQPPDVPKVLSVRGPVTANGVTLTPKRLELAQIIAGPKVKLSTNDRFARVVVTVATEKDATFDLSAATLVQGQDTFELARDVQRVGQGSPLSASVPGGVAQDLVLYFELPEAKAAAGLTLTLPGSLSVPLL